MPARAARRCVLALAVLLAGPALAQSVTVISAYDDFARFWAAAKDTDGAEQERLWASFEAKYRDVYDEVVFVHDAPDWQARRSAELRAAFARLPAEQAAFDALFANAATITATQLASFRRAFPDLHDGMTVVFLPLLPFNAGSRKLARYGGDTLLIGVQKVVENGDALPVLFAHEFFHMYQFDALKALTSGETMASPLWYEGLGSYVSAVMVPQASPAQVLMSAPLAQACDAKAVRQWSRQYLQIVARAWSGEQGASMHKEWFRSTGSAPIKRRGYCVGYHVAALLAKTHTLQQMAHWDEPTYLPEVSAALRTLADGAPLTP